MNAIPNISTSALDALHNGFATLDKGAAELVGGSLGDPPQPGADTADVRSSGSIVESEPMLAGIRDLMLGKLQVGAGAALLHAYNADRRSLLEMLKDN